MTRASVYLFGQVAGPLEGRKGVSSNSPPSCLLVLYISFVQIKIAEQPMPLQVYKDILQVYKDILTSTSSTSHLFKISSHLSSKSVSQIWRAFDRTNFVHNAWHMTLATLAGQLFTRAFLQVRMDTASSGFAAAAMGPAFQDDSGFGSNLLHSHSLGAPPSNQVHSSLPSWDAVCQIILGLVILVSQQCSSSTQLK